MEDSIFSGEMGSTLRIFSGSLGSLPIYYPRFPLSGHNLSLAKLAELPTLQQAASHHPCLIFLVLFLIFKEVSFGTIFVALNKTFSSIFLFLSTHESHARLVKRSAHFHVLPASSQCRPHPPHPGHIFLASRFILLGRLVNSKKLNSFNLCTPCSFWHHLRGLLPPYIPPFLVLNSQHYYPYIWISLFFPHHALRIP
jgi:hypothetical protein